MTITVHCDLCSWTHTYSQEESQHRTAECRAQTGLRSHKSEKHNYRSPIDKKERSRIYQRQRRRIARFYSRREKSGDGL